MNPTPTIPSHPSPLPSRERGKGSRDCRVALLLAMTGKDNN